MRRIGVALAFAFSICCSIPAPARVSETWVATVPDTGYQVIR